VSSRLRSGLRSGSGSNLYIKILFNKMALVRINRKQDLVNLKKKIRNNLMNEYIGEQNLQQDVEKFYKPLIKPLEKIADEPVQNKSIQHEPVQHKPIQQVAIEQPPKLLSIEPNQPEILNIGNIAERYLKTGFKKDYDYAYGIQPSDTSSKFRLGRYDIDIDGNDLIIDGERYYGTVGLWELLTLKEPKNYKEEDEKNYEKIMLKTLPFLNERDLIKPSRGKKYTNFMKNFYKKYYQIRASESVDAIRRRSNSFTEGKGVNIVFLPSDSNELINRFRLLYGSLNAGNSGVFNEFQACTNELFKRDLLDEEDVLKLQ